MPQISTITARAYAQRMRESRQKKDENVTMKRITQIVACLMILTMGVTKSYAQITLQSEAKSLVGIEVHFRFDNSQLDLDYMGNRNALSRFTHVIDSIGLMKIDSIVVVSQSSPEGPYEHNMRLSQRRAATMRRAIERRHPELKDLLRIHPDGESWTQLREFVKNDTTLMQYTIDEVLSVIDSDVNVATKKKRMQQLPVYDYLHVNYYPRIRNSVFCIVYYDIRMTVAGFEEFIYTTVEPSPVPDYIESSAYPISIAPHFEYEPLLNVRTNLLYDLGSALNVGIEYYPHHSHWTVMADYTFPWWSHDASHRYLQMINGSLEARRYFKKDDTHTGHYLSAYAHANLYDFSFDAERAWQGEGAGLGLGYGYVWQPWKNERWKLEAFVRFGYYQSLYDPYHAGIPYEGKYYYDWEGPIENFIRRNHRLRWLGPTGIGVTISYDLFRRKLKIK